MNLTINVDGILDGLKKATVKPYPDALEEIVDVEILRQFRAGVQSQPTSSGLAPAIDVTIVYHGNSYPVMVHDEVGVLFQWHRLERYTKLGLI